MKILFQEVQFCLFYIEHTYSLLLSPGSAAQKYLLLFKIKVCQQSLA